MSDRARGRPRGASAYRLVVMDLDGTARSRRLGITPGVRGAIAAARARGIRVCVATGRMWRSAEPWIRALGVDPPVILYNGGQVLDFERGRTLYERRLPGATARAALELVRRDPEVQPHLYVDDRVLVERPHPLTDAYTADDGLTAEVVPSFEPFLAADPHKVLVIGTRERVEALQRTVRDAALPVHAVQSEPIYLEILPPCVSKGEAFRVMLEVLGLSASETIAVGDNWNDAEMVDAAGLGVVMGHAPEGLRARADYVCGTADEEGVREVIERFVLWDGEPPRPPGGRRCAAPSLTVNPSRLGEARGPSSWAAGHFRNSRTGRATSRAAARRVGLTDICLGGRHLHANDPGPRGRPGPPRQAPGGR